MPDFQTKHPKFAAFLKGAGQNVGTVLSTVGDLTGMKAFNLVGNLLDKAQDLTLEQKQAAKDILLAEMADNEAQEQERTKRLVADDASDSWLAKNVRPMLVIYFTISTTILCVLDSCDVLKIKEVWINLLVSALMMALGFYFVGRTAEKITTTKNS